MKDDDYQALAHILRDWMTAHAPDWTKGRGSDPGVTILELFAFVTESLEAHGDTLPDNARRMAARLARSALALAEGKRQGTGANMARNHYYSGRLLSAEDFQLEQDYFRRRLRRLNRTLRGAGVVQGLQVSVRSNVGGNGEQVVVQPGFAVDPNGEEIEVGSEASAILPQAGTDLFVIVSHCEHLARPAPALGNESVQFTRIEETFRLHLQSTSIETGIVLASLTRTAGGWQVDRSFSVPQSRSGRK